MKIWDTTCALTEGVVFVREARPCYVEHEEDVMECDGGYVRLFRWDYATSPEEAREQVERMRRDKIASLKSQLVRLESLVVEIPEEVTQGASK